MRKVTHIIARLVTLPARLTRALNDRELEDVGNKGASDCDHAPWCIRELRAAMPGILSSFDDP